MKVKEYDSLFGLNQLPCSICSPNRRRRVGAHGQTKHALVGEGRVLGASWGRAGKNGTRGGVCVPPRAGMAAQPPRRDREAAPGLGAVYPPNRERRNSSSGRERIFKKRILGEKKKKK